MLKSSKDNTAEQLQVGQIPSKPVLNPLFRLDYENKIKTNNPQPIEDAPSKPQPIKDVTIQNISDAVVTTSSIVPSNFRRDDSVSRSRSRSRQQKIVKVVNNDGKKRSSESQSEKDHVKGVQRSKYRSKNDVSFSRRSSARLQEKAVSKIQSHIQSDSKINSNKSKLIVLESTNPLNGISNISSTEKKEDSTNITHPDKFYKTRICPQFLNGSCDRGERCTYAHGQQQIRQFQGACFKTKICHNFTQGRCQKRSEQCRYAHGANDLRSGRDSQRNEMKMQVQEKKQYSPQAIYKFNKKGRIQSSGSNKDAYKDNHQGKRNNKGNKFADNRKMHEQISDKQRFQRDRQRTQKSFLQRQKNRQRQQFSKQSTSSTFSRPEYFGGNNNFAQQRQTPNVFRQQYQNVPVYSQPLVQSYPVNPQMLNYSLPDFHNYYMQMQMLQYMPQQPINFYHQYPNYENGMQPFEYRQIGQPSYPVSNANYSRGNQVKKQQNNIPIIDKKIGKIVEKGPDY